MKKITFLIVLFFLVSVNLFSQERNLLLNEKPINKGKITLGDGTSMKFRNLTFYNDQLHYTTMHGDVMEKSSSEVFKVTKSRTYAGYGALSGGLSGLLVCLQYSVEDTNYYGYGYYTSEKEPLTSSEWIMVTAIGAGIGGIIGMLFKNDKTVFQNSSAISFVPSISPNLKHELTPVLTLNLTF